MKKYKSIYRENSDKNIINTIIDEVNSTVTRLYKPGVDLPDNEIKGIIKTLLDEINIPFNRKKVTQMIYNYFYIR